MTKPPWIVEAEKHLGQKEVPGVRVNPWIQGLWYALKGGWLWNTYKDDSRLAWCGAYVGFCLQQVGCSIPKTYYRAKSFLDWGVKLSAPAYGCIAIFTRDEGGHVGFVVGRDMNNRLLILGGNQKDQVCVLPFHMERIAGYRWPKEYGYTLNPLPLIATNEKSSTNES